MGELVQETSQDSEDTELQVPPPAQVPRTADWPALSPGFRLAGVLQQCHLDFNSGVAGSTTLYDWQSE